MGYPSLNALLVCRCFVGRPYVVNAAGDHTTHARTKGFDCVCGDREAIAKTYRELIFLDEAQVYPEFTVIYRRQYQSTMVPTEMQVPTSGSTGRFWQMKVEGSWKNVPAEVNRWLVQLVSDGTAEVHINLHGTEYKFNVEQKIGINLNTGNSVPLREPYNK